MSVRRAPNHWRRIRVDGLPLADLVTLTHYRGPGDCIALLADTDIGRLMVWDGALSYSIPADEVTGMVQDVRFVAAWRAAGLPRNQHERHALLLALGAPPALYGGPAPPLRHWLSKRAAHFPAPYTALLDELERQGGAPGGTLLDRAIHFRGEPDLDDLRGAYHAFRLWLLGTGPAAGTHLH
jgi:hypothetical protein